ncbi:MAG: NAD-dependent epimerase/dehydratase family protein [Elusimicrobia bacterium]|nr:NAD-dependent epimerase/dehydratase family protein [Elusimicrobiota bacterium]
MDSVFVTGATGFVGANLTRLLLDKGYRVRVLLRPGSNRANLDGLDVEPIQGSLEDPKALSEGSRGCRYVFHVAADYRIWVRDPAAMYEANISGTERMIQAAGKAGAERIVYCSSVSAIRPPSDHTPADEDSRYGGVDEVVSVYKKSKYLAELKAMELVSKGLPVVIVNPAAPIGPYDIKPTPTGRIVVDFLNRRLPSYIDTGLNVVHSGDVAQGHLLAAQLGRVGERYILGGENLSFKGLLELLSELTGLAAPRFKTPYAIAYAFAALDCARARLLGGEPVAPLDAVRMAKHYMWYDSSKACRELGYRPRPAKQALADAVRWFEENGYTASRSEARQNREHANSRA